MGKHTSIIYHIVYSTKHRTPCLNKEMRTELFKFIWGILKNKNCHLYRINGVNDHIHIVMSLHPTITLSKLIKDIKLASTNLIKEKNLILNFPGWQVGYGAFTYSVNAKENLIEYVKNQEEHHMKINFREEYISLLKEHGVEYDKKYLFED